MHRRQAVYTKILPHSAKTIALSADGHIRVLDSSTGSILHSTTSGNKLREEVKKSGSFVCADVNESFTHLVVATNDKTVRVWEIDGLSVVSERESAKKPTDIRFTRDGQTILVSDKFGDVHSFPLYASPKPSDATSESTSGKLIRKSEKRLSDGTLLLGHVSLLTTFLLSPDEKYIITADRDEHIRVSWYPEGFTVERFCLGHLKFVSAIHIPSWDSSFLISGGGDPILKIWNWMEGKVLREISIASSVMPFVKVVRAKRSGGGDGSDGEGEGRERVSSRQRRKERKRTKGKDKGKENEAAAGEDGMELDEQVDEEAEKKNESGPLNEDVQKAEPSQRGEPLLAVQKIVAFEHGHTKTIVFSAFGATALFYCVFPDCSDLPSPPPSVEIVHVDLGKPVLDFIYWQEIGEVWVLVDGDWSGDGTPQSDDKRAVRVVKAENGKLLLTAESNRQALLMSLNDSRSSDAASKDLENLDLYSALAVLPKNVEYEHSGADDAPAISEIANEASKPLSNKQLGRLKSKKAVLARTAALATKREESATPAEERDSKRPKSQNVSEADAE